MPTVGQAVDQIAKLRSRIAVSELLVLYLRANYLVSDAGEPEMRVTREDLAMVPQPHLQEYLSGLLADIAETRAQLEHWENLALPAPAEDEKPQSPDTTVVAVARGGVQGKKVSGEAKR